MSTTANNNQHASSSSSASINSEHSKERLVSLEEKLDKLFSLISRFMKQPINSSNNYSAPSSKHDADDSDTEDEDRKERTDTDSVPTDYQPSYTLLDQYKTLSNNQVNVAPFSTPESITASSTLKNNDADLFVVKKRINYTLKPLFLMLNMTTQDSANVDVELIRYLAESASILTVNAQASLGRVRSDNISKEIYGPEVQQPIKIKDTPKMFYETETVISTFKKSGGSNTNGNNSSNSKPNSGSSGLSNNFSRSAGSVASGSNTSKSASGSNNRFQKNKK
ncbi:hypothetical protein ACTFIV_007900 [Dictyostelium citrinum]